MLSMQQAAIYQTPIPRMLNHAMKLADEFVIYVPVEGEEVLDIVIHPSKWDK